MLEFGWGHLFGNGDNRNGGEKKEKKVPTVRPTIPLVTYPSAPRRRRPLSALSTSISLTLPCNLVPRSLTFPVGLRRLLDECGWSLLWGANGVSAPPFFPRLPSPVSPSPSTHPRRFFHSSEKKPAGRRGVVVNHMLSISAHECGCRDGTRQEKRGHFEQWDHCVERARILRFQQQWQKWIMTLSWCNIFNLPCCFALLLLLPFICKEHKQLFNSSVECLMEYLSLFSAARESMKHWFNQKCLVRYLKTLFYMRLNEQSHDLLNNRAQQLYFKLNR